ncbi:MAG TPA: IPT/TIG domain-containing protein [Geobacteraceae bacterium]
MQRFMILALLVSCLVVAPAFGAVAPPQPPAKKAGAPSPQPAKEEAASVAILSIIPSQGEAGTTIVVSGSGFTADTTLYLATTKIAANVAGAKQLSFEVPDLPPGLYALYVRTPRGAASKSYSFVILAQRPVAVDLTPDTVYSCAPASERQVTVSGHHFRDGSQVLFDGAAIRSRFISPDSLSFTAPSVAGGLHQVQVRNPDGSVSGVLGLLIDGNPEITGVTSGEEYVNYYNLYIDGRNFQQGSTVVVTEEKSLDLMAGGQLSVDVKRFQSGVSSGGPERDRIVYVSCNRIVYQRYPYSTVPKNFRVQVVNPDGSQSTTTSVSAP